MNVLLLLSENILIDADQQLKLIDFGLCARPKGGMSAVLETCCGSPAYAAPELVTGQNYLGSEADIWSMGVLLYALLCGFLPFDDENISTLYRKIQSGVYEKPSWLSAGSIALLDCMLQTDPKRRITVSQLLSHPWLMDGYDRPVKWQSKHHASELDMEAVEVLADVRLTSPKEIAEQLRSWDYSSQVTATYFILIERKQRGLPMGLGKRSPLAPKDLNVKAKPQPHQQLLGDSPRGMHISLEGGLDDVELLSMGKEYGNKPSPSPAANASESTPTGSSAQFDRTKNRASERYHIPNKKKLEDKENAGSSTPTRKSAMDSPLSPSRSMDSGLNNSSAPRTPNKTNDWVFATPERPISGSGSRNSNRKVFGSIERGLDKMRNMLTPKVKGGRHSSSSSGDGPALVTGKALCNVSTTSHHNPDTVLTELTRALVSKGIPCQQKGYILRGKIKDTSGFAKLSFELEVCRIPNLNVVGIRRKRLKGDAWCYKKVCEEVLRMAKT